MEELKIEFSNRIDEFYKELSDDSNSVALNVEKGKALITSLKEQLKIAVDDEKEVEFGVLIDDLTIVVSNYSLPSSTSYISLKNEAKLNVVWDLDLALLRSVHVSDNEDKSLHCCVIETFGGLHGKANLHVDDDLIRYKTYLRGWSRFILLFLKPFCTHYIFTSASEGYMINVVKLLENLSEEIGFNIFEDERRSATFFKKHHLRINGKEVTELVQDTDQLNRTVLVDDQFRYHKAQPLRAVVCPVMAHPRHSIQDTTLLNITEILLDLSASGNITSLARTLFETHHTDFFEGLISSLMKYNFETLERGYSDRDLKKHIKTCTQSFFKDKLIALNINDEEFEIEVMNRLEEILKNNEESNIEMYKKMHDNQNKD